MGAVKSKFMELYEKQKAKCIHCRKPMNMTNSEFAVFNDKIYGLECKKCHKRNNMKCIYCNKEIKYHWPMIAVCKSCCDLWNKNWEKFMPHNKEFEKLRKDCEKEVRQVMTGHSCGLERCIGEECREMFFSSDCIGCFPDTKQHYRNAADLVIAWTKNYIQKYIMKNVLLKKSANKIKVEKTNKK